NDTKTSTGGSARQKSGCRAVALEQRGELAWPAQRRAMAAVELVGAEPEAISKHRSRPGRREEPVVPPDDRAGRDVRPGLEGPRLRPRRVRLPSPVREGLLGQLA